LMASVKSDGTVLVEGEEVGVLDGFVFRPTLGEGDEKATILAAARRGLPDEIETRVRAFVASATAAFKLNESGQISWRDSPVARLVRGDGIYAPRPELIASELLSIDQTQRMNTRLSEFVAAHVRDVLGRLVVLETPETAPLPERKPSRPRQPQPAKDVADAPSGPTKDEIAATPPAEQPDIVDVPEQAPEPLSGPARGLAFMMFEGLGTVPSMQAGQQLRGLSETDKPRLARLGLRFGVEAVYLPELLKPAQIELRALLWNLFHGDAGVFHAPPPAGRVTIDMVEGVPDEFWLAVGYRRLGDRVMRVDMVERVSLLVRNAAREGQFRISEEMLSLAGATRDQMAAMLLDMNCKIVSEEPDEDPEKPPIQVFERLRRQRPAGGGRRDRRPQEQNDRPRGRRNAQGQRNRGGRTGGNGTGRGQSQAAKSREPDPQSPFAVLAQLKQKS
ncbi:MAG: disulfide oxidoreductase, partial [Pseudomonadota bacterium]|nr:disulfide oxidoreductase [Pseudomonadota bacterium]